MTNDIKNISVIGDGGWGTTLAIHLAKKKYNVTVWSAFPKYAKQVQKSRVNTKFLPGIKIPKSVTFTGDIDEAISLSQLIVIATPSSFIESVLKKIKKCNLNNKVFLSVVKGINTTTLFRMSQTIALHLGPVPLAVLSGPTIAKEVAKGIPSTAVIASHRDWLAKKLQEVFNSDTFRVYTNNDVIGVELGGSLKNIIAIACGVCDGLGFGTNAKSAILTRGVAEMARLGKVLGAQVTTFAGLTGLGDLATTCFAPSSRNRTVGEQLGKGKTIKQIQKSMQMVAEGVETSKAVYKLSKKINVSMPITEQVYNIIYKRKKPAKAVQNLMSRKTKSE